MTFGVSTNNYTITVFSYNAATGNLNVRFYYNSANYITFQALNYLNDGIWVHLSFNFNATSGLI
jgi:hypothetical protein